MGYDTVIFNGNVLGHAWHIWCENGSNGKKMSCSLHPNIKMNWLLEQWSFWIWITFFFRTVIWVSSPLTNVIPINNVICYFSNNTYAGLEPISGLTVVTQPEVVFSKGIPRITPMLVGGRTRNRVYSLVQRGCLSRISISIRISWWSS